MSHTGGNALSAYNETPPLRGSPNKWCSQVTEASQTCHRPGSSALIYKHCLGGLSAIANPTGTTIWMAVESDLLKKNKKPERGRQRCITPSRNRCRDALLFIIDFQGQHLVVIVCLTRPWLAPWSSSTTGRHMEQPPATRRHHAGILTSPCGISMWDRLLKPYTTLF